MDRLLALFLLVLAGCNPSPPKLLVGGGAILSAVSSDQQSIAVLTHAIRLPTGLHVGALEVAPGSGGTPLQLDGMSDGGVFNRGNTLWYLGGAHVVSEDAIAGTPPVVAHVYGRLFIWSPSLAAPIAVGQIVRDYSVAQDGGAAVFMDWSKPSNDAATTGALVAVSASSCGGGACNRMVIADGVTGAQTAWRLSSDGRFAILTVRGVAATDPGQVVLVSFDAATATVVSTGVNPRAPMMSHDGSTVAWVEGANEIHVMPAAGGAATVIVPTSAIVETAAMVDPSTYIARALDTTADPPTLVKLSADGAVTPLPVERPLELFVSQYVPGKTDRYAFFELDTIAANGEPDLWMIDHVTPGAQPVQLANAVENPIGVSIGFSDDGSSCEYLDNFDPVTRRGDEFIVPLAAPVRTLVGVGMHNAAFIPGDAHLIYVNAPDPSTGAGVLTTLSSPTAIPDVHGVGSLNFVDSRQPPARTWFTQLTGAPDDGVWYMPQP